MPLPSGTRVNGAPSQSRVWTNADLKTAPGRDVVTAVPSPEEAAIAALGDQPSESADAFLARVQQELLDDRRSTMTPLPSHDPISHGPSDDYTDPMTKAAPYAFGAADLLAIPASFYPPTALPARAYLGVRGATNVGDDLSRGDYKGAAIDTALNFGPEIFTRLRALLKGGGKAVNAGRTLLGAAPKGEKAAAAVAPDLPVKEGEILADTALGAGRPQRALSSAQKALPEGQRQLPGWAQRVLSGGGQKALPPGRGEVAPPRSPKPAPSAPPGTQDPFVEAFKPGASTLTPKEASKEDAFWREILKSLDYAER